MTGPKSAFLEKFSARTALETGYNYYKVTNLKVKYGKQDSKRYRSRGLGWILRR